MSFSVLKLHTFMSLLRREEQSRTASVMREIVTRKIKLFLVSSSQAEGLTHQQTSYLILKTKSIWKEICDAQC